MIVEYIVDAMDDIAEEYKNEVLSEDGYFSDGSESKEIYMMNRKHTKKFSRTALIAAAIAALFAVTAYAIGYFTMSGREAYGDEKYYIKWDDSETGFLEWTDLTYILQFEGPEECMGAKFKEGWLPFAPNQERNAWACDEDGWRTNLVSELAPEVDSMSDNYQPYRVELFYAPQFLNDGALVMMDQTPGEITEEQWGEDQVIKFTATKHQDAVNIDDKDVHIPEKDKYYYFVIRFNPDMGYIVVISGTSDMETIEHIARELQIKQTDEIIRSGDFVDNCTFIDVGQG